MGEPRWSRAVEEHLRATSCFLLSVHKLGFYPNVEREREAWNTSCSVDVANVALLLQLSGAEDHKHTCLYSLMDDHMPLCLFSNKCACFPCFPFLREPGKRQTSASLPAVAKMWLRSFY